MPRIAGTPFLKLFQWSLHDDAPIALYSDAFHERIISWRFIDVSRGQDSLEIVLDNSDLFLYEFVDARWKRVFGCVFGYEGGETSPRRVMQIRKFTGGKRVRIVAVPDFRLSDRDRVHVYEWDEMIAASRVPVDETVVKIPDKTKFIDGVVRTIAHRHGFLDVDIDIEPYTGRIEHVRSGLFQNETDMEFLDFLAKKIDYELNIDNGIFSFRDPYSEEFPEREILYGSSISGVAPESQASHYTELLDFEPDIDILKYPAPIHRRGFDPKRKRDLAVVGSDQTDPTVTWDSKTLETSDSMRTPFVPFAGEGGTSRGSGAPSQDMAQADADSDYHEDADSWMKARATVRGDPRLSTGRPVIVRGLGPTYSGVYKITEAEHINDANGFVTKLQMGRRGTTAAELVADAAARRAAAEAAADAAAKAREDEAEEKRKAILAKRPSPIRQTVTLPSQVSARSYAR